jgi:hypothetical protein
VCLPPFWASLIHSTTNNWLCAAGFAVFGTTSVRSYSTPPVFGLADEPTARATYGFELP